MISTTRTPLNVRLVLLQLVLSTIILSVLHQLFLIRQTTKITQMEATSTLLPTLVRPGALVISILLKCSKLETTTMAILTIRLLQVPTHTLTTILSTKDL